MLLPAFSHFFHAYKDIFGFILFHFAGKGMGLKQLLFTAKQRPSLGNCRSDLRRTEEGNTRLHANRGVAP